MLLDFAVPVSRDLLALFADRLEYAVPIGWGWRGGETGNPLLVESHQFAEAALIGLPREHIGNYRCRSPILRAIGTKHLAVLS